MNGLADTIAHETGHTFGLFHLNPSLSTQLMHGGTNPEEFATEQVFSATAYPTYFANAVHPDIVESSAARLQFAAGTLGTPIAGQNFLPDPALLNSAAAATNKADIALPPGASVHVADLLVGVETDDGDIMPTFQDLGGGDLTTLLNNANIPVGPDDSLLVIGSTLLSAHHARNIFEFPWMP